ncbi:hypothetical protein MD484_g8230, partial [Candolleomyces efflorescens]
MKLIEGAIVFRSPWVFEEGVRFETFVDRTLAWVDEVRMLQACSGLQLEYSLSLPKNAIVALLCMGACERSWFRVTMVAILKLSSHSFRANTCVDLSCGSDEAVGQVWLSCQFAKLQTLDWVEVEEPSIRKPLIPRPRGDAARVSTTLDWGAETYQLLQDWIKTQIDEELDPTKPFQKQKDGSVRKAIAMFPALKQYEGNWPVVALLTAKLRDRTRRIASKRVTAN